MPHRTVFRSYAQNREDVVLSRMFRNTAVGQYVEVGAYHPVIKSISFHAYLRGWRGVLVEPQRSMCRLLRSARPGDHVVCAAAGERKGRSTFFEVQNATRSTLMPSIAESYRDRRTTSVAVNTLSSILEKTVDPHLPINFMSIDVEGAEKQVLEGLDLSRFRPQVLIIEAIHPVSHEDTSLPWQEGLESHGYQLGFFDGVSKYFVDSDFPKLLELCYPASSADRFIDDFPQGVVGEMLAHTQDLDRTRRDLLALLTWSENHHVDTINDLAVRMSQTCPSEIDRIETLAKLIQAATSRARSSMTGDRHLRHAEL